MILDICFLWNKQSAIRDAHLNVAPLLGNRVRPGIAWICPQNMYNSMKSKLMADYLVLKYWTHLRWGKWKAAEYKAGTMFYQPVSLKHFPLGILVEQNCFCSLFEHQIWVTAHTDNKSIKSDFTIYLFCVSKGYVTLLKIPQHYLTA